MIEMLKRNPLIAALGVLCAVLLGVVVLELVTASSSAVRTRSAKAAPVEAKLLPPLAATSADQVYPETVNRPLWIPTRRPAPPVAASAASFPRGQYVLLGVTIAGLTRIALLKEKASGRIHRAEKGQSLNGVQIAEVEPEKVTLSQGAESEVLELLVQRPGGPAQPGQPAQPAQHAPPVQTSGPFAPVNPAGATAAAIAASGMPGASPVGTQPSAQVSAGPLSPHQVLPAANPSVPVVPQQPASTAPMTPEELLARRRARRNQNP